MTNEVPRKIGSGMTRAEIDRAENKDFALGSGPLRPRDAATLILIDRAGPAPRVLLGRRHRKHAFMPGKFVFPGGRTDPHDARLAGVVPLDSQVEAKLLALSGARATPSRARAIALSAVRETYEEAGLLIGERQAFATGLAAWAGFAEHGVRPSLAGLRYIARATTPPGRVRRFDTRFFAAFADSIAATLEGGGPTGELEELVWLTLDDAIAADIPSITRTILHEIDAQLRRDPLLTPGGPVPYYRMLHNRFVRQEI